MLEFPQFYSTAPKAPATLRGRGILHINCFWKTSFPRVILCNLTQLLWQRVLLAHYKCKIRKLKKTCSLTFVNNFYDTCVNVDKSVEIGDFFKNKDEYVTFLSKNAFSQKTFKSKWYWTGQKNGRQDKVSLEK